MTKNFTLFTLLFFAFSTATTESFAAKTNKIEVEDLSDSEFESYAEQNDKPIHDPLEKYNRKIFVFNDFFDQYFFQYVAKEYRKDIPKPARDSIRNFLTNLNAPISAFNSFVQGKGSNGLATLSNFLINSTIGVLGIFNVAEEKGIRYNREDFGQTLGHYGVKSGPYLVLPFIGPSSVRDFSGLMTDQFVSPASYNATKIGGHYYLIGEETLVATTLVGAVDKREGLIEILDDARKDSFDYYATLRSAYLQQRDNQIKN